MKGAFSRIGQTIGLGKAKPGYTPPDKKGEINELKAALSDPNIDRDQNKKREILSKVITYTTMGLDTSKLFDKMMLCVNTKDVVQKKMVYQYVTHYAHSNQELAILTINTLAKDCRDESPLIRGLALRSLSSLRMSKSIEYLVPLIKEGLNDPSPYVRKTAVLSVVKLNRISPQSVQSFALLQFFIQLFLHFIVVDEELVDRLYSMIRDKDPQVTVNSIVALNDVLAASGETTKVPKKLAFYLLNRIQEYSEWQLSIIMEELMKYTPQSNQEVFDIMNLLDDRLLLNNSSVILAIASLFLKFTENLPKIHQKVYGRLREPLLLLLSTASNELTFAILSHIKLMITRAPTVFTPYFKDFFMRHHDAPYVKMLKMETLTLVATPDNVKEIMEELAFYVTIGDVDVETSKKAIRCLGEIAVKISSASELSLTYLLDFLESGIKHVLSETFVVLKDILRKYNNPDFCATYLPQITKHWRDIESPESQVAFLWILGEYGDVKIIEYAPYILEQFRNMKAFSEYDYTVRNEMLTAAMKLFFKRAPEMQKILGSLIATAIEDASHEDVHDKALFYYRLLSTNVQYAKQVVAGSKNFVSKFTEEESVEYRDRLFSEFNTLSIVFSKPSERFIVQGPAILGATEEEEEEEEEVGGNGEEEEELQQEQQDESKQSLLSMGDEYDYRLSSPMQTQQPQQQQQFGIMDSFGNTLNGRPNVLQPMDYQDKWEDMALHSKSYNFQLRARPRAADVEKLLLSNRIVCITYNEEEEPVMFYFYAEPAQNHGDYYLIETKILSNGMVMNLIKHTNPQLLNQFAEFFKNCFAPYM